MKVSIEWLKQLVDLKASVEELVRLLNLKTIATKEVTQDYIELDMKGYNRADLLSVRGVALEVAAITGSSVSFAEPGEDEYIWVGQDLPRTDVKVDTENLCPLYCVAKIEGLKAEKTPPKWVKKLEDSGLRTAGSIVDVTNLVMLEYGQPLHAFDARGVKDQTLVVREAQKGERLVTLDGKVRQLLPTDLLIADPERPLGLAGVMGGKDSEVSDSTATILLEAAIFDGGTLRQTSSRLRLQSEASKRFQHGLTKKRLLQALNAAIRMYQDLGGRLTAISLTGSLEDETRNISLTRQKAGSLTGIDLKSSEIESNLKRLSFQPVEKGPGEWAVEIPYFRRDIEVEEDLIEEVARMYGYENIPPKRLTGEAGQKVDQSLLERVQELKSRLVDGGLTEVQTYSFYSTASIVNCQLSIVNLLKVANPMSAETEYLRDRLWPNMVETAVKNLKYGFEDVAVFETGKVYNITQGRMPEERYHLSIALSNNSDNPIQELFSLLQKALGDRYDTSMYNSEEFHPTRSFKLQHKGQEKGFMAEVHPRIINRFGVEKRVAVLEIEI